MKLGGKAKGKKEERTKDLIKDCLIAGSVRMGSECSE